MNRTQKTDEQLAALASHLSVRRSAILEAWREAVNADPELSAPSSLPRTQFNDHIPELLDAFEKSLRICTHQERIATTEEEKEDAAGHGLQRWQQGYHLREVTRDWGHLQLCLVSELEEYSTAHDDLEPSTMPTAWRALATLCSQGVSESTTQYFHLQQVEAEGHLRDMEQTLDEVRVLDGRRMEMFRQAAHDLRGNLGVVKNVSSGLTQEIFPEEMRPEFLRLLESSVTSLHSMLDEVMDLTRLQAGQELRDVKPIDVAKLLKELLDSLQAQAKQRGLFLNAEGAETLIVDGDAIKVRRIAQNLLLNALKYTQAGGVTMGWGDSRNNDAKRWMLWVKDTGPGFHAGPGAPLAEALKEATAESKQNDEHTLRDKQESKAQLPDRRPVYQESGEGIGLSIVKRLCELLDASIELESKPGIGSTFRVIFPRHYDAATKKE
jgi:signal transduction histidine kinase